VRRARPDSTHYLVNVYEGVEVASLDPRPSRASSHGVHRKAEDGGDAPASTTDDNAARCPWGGAQQDMGSGDVTFVPRTGTARPGLPAETVDPDVLHVQTLVGMSRKR
jgi:hypothetical protein